MRRLMAAVAATALMGATEAAAENWQAAGADAEQIIGVEVTSIGGDDRLRTATVLFVFARTRAGGADIVMSAAGFDCVAHTVAVVTTDVYAADGTLLSSSADGEDAADMPIERGSLIQSVEEVVCQGQRYPPGLPDAMTFAAAAREVLQRGGTR